MELQESVLWNHLLFLRLNFAVTAKGWIELCSNYRGV